jgi:hypothetical protein
LLIIIEAPNLGKAGAYVILSKFGISTIPASDITGDIAVSPHDISYVNGFSLKRNPTFWTSTQVTGKVKGPELDPEEVTTAISDMENAFYDMDYIIRGKGDVCDHAEYNAGEFSGA